MSKYKMVPVEPTAQMLQAGQEAWLKDPLQRSSTLYKAVLAAAPDAQGEPVTWPLASKEESDKGWTIDYRFLEQVEKVASQRTDFTTSMEAVEQVLIAASELLCAPHPAVQQPDVTRLVEALKAVMEFGCDPKSNRGKWALEKAGSTLAAYRKGSES